jgi:NDP-sugar pyrophosphorylase family protein
MKAMVLAAGLGTRLRPLTDGRPKALVTVAGRTLLDICLARLRSFGVSEVIVNTHHYSEMIVAYLHAHNNFGMRIEVSPEPDLLDTGGGLKHVAAFFLDPPSPSPFLLHNVDVVSTVDLADLVRFHTERNAVATLAVQHRATSRPLLFDTDGQLRGRLDPASPAPAGLSPLAFAGIHVLSPRIFAALSENGTFSIIDAYIRLASQGESILACTADGAYWRDLGRPASLDQFALEFASGAYPQG